MNKRKWILSGLGVLLLLLSFYLAANMDKEEAQRGTGPDEVAVAVRAEEMHADTRARYLKITGRLIPQQRVKLFAEVGGVAEFGDKPFKPGTPFGKGDVLLRINADELRSNLAAARSELQSLLAGVVPDLSLDFPEQAQEWLDYLDALDVDKRLPALPEIDDRKLSLFLSGRGIFSNYYSIREAETRLEKHVLHAPFAGTLTAVEVDQGELVRVGQALGELISTGRYELEAGVAYRDVGSLSPGTFFALSDVNSGLEYEAKVLRINDAVDPLSQLVKVYAEVRDSRARSGIYLEGKVVAERYEDALRIPLSALVDERAIFVVHEDTARLMEVDILHKSAEYALVTAPNASQKVILDRHNPAFDGSAVRISNF